MTFFILLPLSALIVFVLIILVTGKKKILFKFYIVLAAMLIIIIPFWRYFLVQALFYYHSQDPLMQIHKTVEKPISVYWEDNVYPGFTESDRKAMVSGFLDGVHLKLLVLNGDDGKYYVYRATEQNFKNSLKILPELNKAKEKTKKLELKADEYIKNKKERKKDHIILLDFRKAYKASNELSIRYEELRKIEVVQIYENATMFEDKSKLPKVNYKVILNQLPKSWMVNDDNYLLYADKISFVETKTNKVIAFSKRYMAYLSAIKKRFTPYTLYFDYKIGYEYPYILHERILFNYVYKKGSFGRRNKLYQKLYKNAEGGRK